MTQTLRQAITDHKPLIAPSIYDGISALVAKEFGFPAVYIGSYATGAAKYGLPDIGYLGVEDMADQVRRLAPLAGVPVIVDGEGGFGNPLHVAEAIKRLERAGADGVHIEDHEFGKHITPRPAILPIAKAVDKIKAALDARSSSEMLIIARTDAAMPLGADEALARAVAFQEAGADAVFLAGYGFRDTSDWDAVRRNIHVPVFNTDMPGRSAVECAALGVGVVLYYGLSHFVAQQAVRSAFQTLAETGSAVSLNLPPQNVLDFDAFLGIGQAREDAQRFGLID